MVGSDAQVRVVESGDVVFSQAAYDLDPTLIDLGGGRVMLESASGEELGWLQLSWLRAARDQASVSGTGRVGVLATRDAEEWTFRDFSSSTGIVNAYAGRTGYYVVVTAPNFIGAPPELLTYQLWQAPHGR